MSSTKEVFPYSATLADQAMIFDIPGPQQPEQGHIHQNRPFPNLAFYVLSKFKFLSHNLVELRDLVHKM